MDKKLTLEELIQGSSDNLGIKEILSVSGLKKEISDPHIIHIPFSLPKRSIPNIAIINPQVLDQLRMMEKSRCRQMLKHIFDKEVLLIFYSSSSSIPEFFKKYSNKYNTPVVASELDEHYLESLLTGLLNEKLNKKTSFHGVVFETQGKGILVTGASGIGKTSAALHIVQEGSCWVADDVALVKKNRKGELIVRGHDRIKNLIYTKETGIIPVNGFLDLAKIKKNTKLTAVIEVEKVNETESLITKRKREILGTILPCLRISIPSCSYLDKNLLKKSIRKLAKDN